MMAYRPDNAGTRLDRLATRLTGGQVHYGITGPYITIAFNLVLLLAGVAGMTGVIMGGEMNGLLQAVLIAGTFHGAFVQYKERGNAPLDERENAIRWKAMALGAGISGMLLVVWMCLLGGFADQGMWHPAKEDDWMAVAMFAVALAAQINAIAKAWMTPAYAAELLDDD